MYNFPVIQFPLSTILLIYGIFLFCFFVVSFFNLYHLIRYGIYGYGLYLIIVSFAIGTILLIGGSITLLSQYNWNHPISPTTSPAPSVASCTSSPSLSRPTTVTLPLAMTNIPVAS